VHRPTKIYYTKIIIILRSQYTRDVSICKVITASGLTGLKSKVGLDVYFKLSCRLRSVQLTRSMWVTICFSYLWCHSICKEVEALLKTTNDSSSSSEKHGAYNRYIMQQFKLYTPVLLFICIGTQTARIESYAHQYGVTAAARHFSRVLKCYVTEKTVRSIRNAY